MLLEVICISVRESCPEQVQVGSTYYLDISSLYLDRDGDSYVDVYKNKEKTVRCGNMLLKHFMGVNWVER